MLVSFYHKKKSIYKKKKYIHAKDGVMGIVVIKERDISLESVTSKHILEANLSKNDLGLFGPLCLCFLQERSL